VRRPVASDNSHCSGRLRRRWMVRWADNDLRDDNEDSSVLSVAVDRLRGGWSLGTRYPAPTASSLLLAAPLRRDASTTGRLPDRFIQTAR